MFESGPAPDGGLLLGVVRTIEDLAASLHLPAGRPAPGFTVGGLAWSPDGTWLALTISEEIRIFGASRSEPAHVLPVRARAVG